jgi:hypothetical protein
MTYACNTWEYAADPHLSKLQSLQNRVFRAIENFGRRTPFHKMQVAFKIPHVYDYITILCRAGAKVILNHINKNVRGIGQGEAMQRKCKRPKLGDGQAYDRTVSE